MLLAARALQVLRELVVTEQRVILYGLRLWGVFFFVDGLYRFVPGLLSLAFNLYEGKYGPYRNWGWYWWFEALARPVVETAAGVYLIWGGAWLAHVIVRRVQAAEAADHPRREDPSA